MHGGAILILSGILAVGFACQWIAWRVKLPSILFLLLAGVAAGPAFGWLEPDTLFGGLLEPFVSLAVAVILYEGSLTLKLSGIRGHGSVVRNLVTLGVATTWIVATLSSYYLLHWDLYLSALFGAIVTVSGPTVITPLLRSVRPARTLASILRWEGILVDPLGAILAVLVFNFIVVNQSATTTGQLYESFVLILLVGTGLGVAAGQSFGVVLTRHWVPDYLRDYAALALVILVFGLAETIASDSGLLAVTVMGVWQANMRGVDLEDILDFKESLTLVLVAGLFIILAARIDLTGLRGLGVGAVAVLGCLQFLGGPARAAVSSFGSGLGWRERVFLGWIFPRGIVAAAVSALFALRLENAGYPGAADLVPMVFLVIVGTVVVQSLTGGLVARGLRVADPEPNGVLVVGANPVALMFARALHEAGQRVLVASMSWEGISKARMAGYPVYYGSPVSSYADRHLDLVGLGYLLALSSRPGLNELACVKYKYEFGRNAVFTVPQRTEKAHEKHQISGEAGGRVLFSGGFSMDDLQQIVSRGVQTRTTEITGTYDFDDYLARNSEAMLLFVTDANGQVRFPAAGANLKVPAGSRVTSLMAEG